MFTFLYRISIINRGRCPSMTCAARRLKVLCKLSSYSTAIFLRESYLHQNNCSDACLVRTKKLVQYPRGWLSPCTQHLCRKSGTLTSGAHASQKQAKGQRKEQRTQVSRPLFSRLLWNAPEYLQTVETQKVIMRETYPKNHQKHKHIHEFYAMSQPV